MKFSQIRLLLILLLFTVLAGAVPEIGDLAELNFFLNGRSAARFTSNDNNIVQTLPKGTVGKIKEIKNFSSGNQGLKLEVKLGSETKNLWVYYTPNRPNMTFHQTLEEAQQEPIPKAEKKQPQQNQYARTKNEISAIDQETPKLKKSTESALQQLQKKPKEDNCLLCNANQNGKTLQEKCPNKSLKIGVYQISQTMNEGQCEFEFFHEDRINQPFPRKYSMNSAGSFQSLDPQGARTYYFFPRTRTPSFEAVDNGEAVLLKTASEVEVKISARTGKIIQISPAVSWKEGSYSGTLPASEQHLQLKLPPHLSMISTGFQKEGIPESKPGRRSDFIQGDKKCSLSNRILFKQIFKDGYYADTRLNFESDAALKEILNKNSCR